MLPNHAPLVIAEQFGTLEALHPGRIDLGLGRAPGSDQATSRALRRYGADEFPQDVVELIDFFSDEPQQRVRAVPGTGMNVPIWILGSSLFGAQLAAALGLPYAFASHFAPAHMMQAIALYRESFKPSQRLSAPYVMLGFNVFAADSDRAAQLIASSSQQAFVNIRLGTPTRLPPPVEGYLNSLGPREHAVLDEVLSCSAVGSPETIVKSIETFVARTRPDELMLSSMIYDHRARLRSYEIIANLRAELGAS